VKPLYIADLAEYPKRLLRFMFHSSTVKVKKR
jgi:hypothetical protein